MPELTSVAIVPNWVVPQEHVPPGIIKSRTPEKRPLRDVMEMALQLHGCLRGETDTILQYLNAADVKANELAQLLRERATEITQLEAEIAHLRAARRELGGDDRPPQATA